MKANDQKDQSPLGRQVWIVSTYTPGLLFRMGRKAKRDEVGIPGELPFRGWDIWNAYEFSWLNRKGRPEVAIAEFRIPCQSENIIEAKSFKLYLNSFAQSKFDRADEVRAVLTRDLSEAAGAEVSATLRPLNEFEDQAFSRPEGECLDSLDVETSDYEVEPDFLKASENPVEEALHSNLLRSKCPVTDQPDWGTVWFRYAGGQIDHEGLLKYVISFREHKEFQELCVERMFVDILRRCNPQRLTVYARYTRRGGLDINPFRSNCGDQPDNTRLPRQ